MIRRRALLAGVSAAAIAARAAQGQATAQVAAQAVLAPAAPVSPQAPKRDDTVAQGFQRRVIARWGDAVLANAPPFDPYPLTLAQADTQFPYDGVIAGLVRPPPAEDGIPRRVLVTATPDAPARMVFPAGMDIPAVAGRLQGATVMNLQYLQGRWVTVDGGYQSRRISDGTLCQISGPVAAQIGNTVQGVLAPQTGCITPWGTVLLAEGDAGPWLARLAGVGYGFADPTDAPRFGWITELDALQPLSFPIKRTGLGRFARAGVAVAQTADGRAVVFMTQDDPAGMLFRFVSDAPATDGGAFDSGTLSVARIVGDEIEFLPLSGDVPSLVGAAGAAASAGGSAFDGPGGIAIARDGAALYLACRGNPARAATDAFNPRAGDDTGHILVFGPPGGDLTAKRFAGNLALVAGDPATVPLTQYTPGSNAWLRCPRTLNLDPLGQLWIGTDQGGEVSATADGVFIMQTGGPSPYLLSLAYL
ncbi:MAG: hypothetical protein B7Z81_10395, partial [Acidocella sp. 20-61-6]